MKFQPAGLHPFPRASKGAHRRKIGTRLISRAFYPILSQILHALFMAE
jgi:hypothetical protein